MTNDGESRMSSPMCYSLPESDGSPQPADSIESGSLCCDTVSFEEKEDSDCDVIEGEYTNMIFT